MDQEYKSKIADAFSKAVTALNNFSEIQSGFMPDWDSPESRWLAWEYLTQEGIDN